MTYTILVVVQVLVALTLVGLILVQHGKGADAGAAFGSGASGTVFGAQGSANFMSRATAALATVFFVVSLTLAYLIGGDTAPSSDSITEQLGQTAEVLQMPEDGGTRSEQAPATEGADGGESATQQTPAGADEGAAAAQEQTDNDEGGVTAQVPE